LNHEFLERVFFSSVPFQRGQNEMQEIGEQVLENRNQVG